jgi:hypothetical protein
MIVQSFCFPEVIERMQKGQANRIKTVIRLQKRKKVEESSSLFRSSVSSDFISIPNGTILRVDAFSAAEADYEPLTREPYVVPTLAIALSAAHFLGEAATRSPLEFDIHIDAKRPWKPLVTWLDQHVNGFDLRFSYVRKDRSMDQSKPVFWMIKEKGQSVRFDAGSTIDSKAMTRWQPKSVSTEMAVTVPMQDEVVATTSDDSELETIAKAPLVRSSPVSASPFADSVDYDSPRASPIKPLGYISRSSASAASASAASASAASASVATSSASASASESTQEKESETFVSPKVLSSRFVPNNVGKELDVFIKNCNKIRGRDYSQEEIKQLASLLMQTHVSEEAFRKGQSPQRFTESQLIDKLTRYLQYTSMDACAIRYGGTVGWMPPEAMNRGEDAVQAGLWIVDSLDV